MSPGIGRAIRRFAPAKVNLYLHVTGRRADGYHLLDSLVVFADIGDEITAWPSDDFALDLAGPMAGAIKADRDNLVWRAAHLLAERAGIAPRAHLVLTKRLPVAAGLGGGSADAAAAISALVELWQLNLDEAELDLLALELGADVPVCRVGRAQLVSGIGEILHDAPPLPAMPLVLVNPGFGLATRDVFAALGGAGSPADPLDRAPADLADLGRMLGRRRNDLEAPARRLAPELDRVLGALAAQPACLVARMSGSGASCFGLFADDASAAAALPRLGQAHPDWWLTQARIGDRAGRP